MRILSFFSIRLSNVKQIFKKMLRTVWLGVFFTMIISLEVNAAPILSAKSSPEILKEDNLNGAIINLTLIGDKYKPTIGVVDIKLNHAPGGTTVSGVNWISDTIINIVISFNGRDFDSTISDFSVTVLATGIVGNVNVNSNRMIIYPVVEGTSVTGSTIPEILFEKNLTGSQIKLTLVGSVDFESNLTPNLFSFNNAPTGLYISNVYRHNNDNASLELLYDGTDFDTDITNFSITLLPLSNNKNTYITSNDITIKAGVEIEGEGYYFSTGKSYPITVQISGYNSRSKNLYLNFQLRTNHTVLTNQTAIFYYFIEVFNDNGSIIGNSGTIDNTQTVASMGQDAYVKNLQIDLNSLLTSSFRVVITVVRVEVY